MKFSNQMQDRLLAAMRAMADEWGLDWVEIAEDLSRGTVRLQQPGRYRTLLKIEYEFQAQRYRLLVYREGKQICGRCSVDYDDGVAIEQFLTRFRCLFPNVQPGAPSGDFVPARRPAASSHAPLSELGMHFRPTPVELAFEQATFTDEIPTRG